MTGLAPKLYYLLIVKILIESLRSKSCFLSEYIHIYVYDDDDNDDDDYDDDTGGHVEGDYNNNNDQ